jgi:mRNA interferase RelE/StbE
MGSYRLVFRASVAKDLRDLPGEDVTRILKRIESLALEPRPPGSEKLSASERYRVRQGRYRVLYEVSDARCEVLVVKVAHRREVYRQA